MSITPQTQAVLLLTAYFSKPGKGDPKPLSPKEWGRFALWLKDRSLHPENLMAGDIKALLDGWSDKTINFERIDRLMNRGSALALAMEKWMRAGLWVLTRSDTDYPLRLKQKLRTDSPAVLFGCGNTRLLNQGGIAVVGARNASDGDLAFTRELATKSASEGFSIVSGGARGVDETAMLGALEVEGTVIGVLADSLLKVATSNKYRRHLLNKNLVLISPFYPEAGFNTGNAMARNKYIYCLSDAAVVVQSGKKGGTWSGALENLKKSWVPLWVKPTSDRESGNGNIVNEGGNWLPDSLDNTEISELVRISEGIENIDNEQDLFSQSVINKDIEGDEPTLSVEKGSNEETLNEESPITEPKKGVTDNELPNSKRTTVDIASISFYEIFLLKMSSFAADKPRSVDEMVDELNLNKTQIHVWLKQAVTDKKIKKLSKPVRYLWQAGEKQQIGMFEDQ